MSREGVGHDGFSAQLALREYQGATRRGVRPRPPSIPLDDRWGRHCGRIDRGCCRAPVPGTVELFANCHRRLGAHNHSVCIHLVDLRKLERVGHFQLVGSRYPSAGEGAGFHSEDPNCGVRRDFVVR